MPRECFHSRSETSAEVDASMKTTLEKSKIVLFMEGTADAPKSVASLNVIKMLTAAQVPCLDPTLGSLT